MHLCHTYRHHTVRHNGELLTSLCLPAQTGCRQGLADRPAWFYFLCGSDDRGRHHVAFSLGYGSASLLFIAHYTPLCRLLSSKESQGGGGSGSCMCMFNLYADYEVAVQADPHPTLFSYLQVHHVTFYRVVLKNTGALCSWTSDLRSLTKLFYCSWNR